MDESSASRLLDEAMSHPLKTYRRTEILLEGDDVDAAIASIVLRARGIAARSVASITESIDVLRDSIERAGRAGRGDLARLSEVTLAGSLYIAGRADEALAVLDHAADGAEPAALSRIDFQRATLLARAGRLDAAIGVFDGLLDRFAAEGDELFVASTYGNRGLTRLDRGDAAAARADLEAARDGFAACGATFKVATMDHNLGRVAGRRGDLVQALDRFAAAERQLVELGEDTAEIQANRVEVLLESGLFDEAARVAAATERAMGSAGLELDRAEIALARSLALLGADDLRGATEHAQRAAGLFAAEQRSGWAEEATVVARRAEARLGSAVDVAELADVARALAAGGRRLAALQAWSVVATRDPRLAAAEARGVGLPAAEQPLELRLVQAEITAREQAAIGDVPGALRHDPRRGGPGQPAPTRRRRRRRPRRDRRAPRGDRPARPRRAPRARAGLGRRALGRRDTWRIARRRRPPGARRRRHRGDPQPAPSGPGRQP